MRVTKEWSTEETKHFKELVPTHTYAVIAQKLGRSYNSVRQHFQHLASKGELPRRNKSHNGIMVTQSNDVLIELPQKYLDIPRVTAEAVMSFSDIHLPFIDWDLFYKLMAVAKRQCVRTCIIGGDVFDYKQFSSFPDEKDGKDELSMAEAAATKFFSMLLDQFDKIYVICGNHDFRVVKWSQGILSQRRFFRYLASITKDEQRVDFSSYHHLILNDHWRFVHPNTGATNFEAEGRAMAAKYQQSIVVPHVHRLGVCFDSSGRYCIVGNGALIDPTTQAYIMTIPSKYPMWNTGATIIRGEVPYLFPKHRTDWDLWTKRKFL